MFDYTRAIYEKTKKDLESALTVFQFGTQILYISYLTYLILTPNSIWYLHASLLAISVAFLVFDLITTNGIKAIREQRIHIFGKRMRNKRLAHAKKQRKGVKKIKFYTSHVIKLFVLSSTFYPIIVAPSTVHPLSIMCTTVMVLLWILQIVLEVLKLVLEGRGELFMEALNADIEFVTKPVNTVKNTFKKIIGQETEESPAPTKDRIYLDKLVKAAKDEKTAKKAEAKAARNEKLSAWLDTKLSKFTSKQPVDLTVREDVQESTAEIKDAEINLIDAPEAPEAIEAPETATITD